MIIELTELLKKIKNNEDVIKNILNVTWDIYHIRLIEQIFYMIILNKRESKLFYLILVQLIKDL